jgi:hypothetical protein
MTTDELHARPDTGGPGEPNRPAQGVSTLSTTTTSQAEHHVGASSS